MYSAFLLLVTCEKPIFSRGGGFLFLVLFGSVLLVGGCVHVGGVRLIFLKENNRGCSPFGLGWIFKLVLFFCLIIIILGK